MSQKFSDYYPNSDVKVYPENIAGMLGLPSVGNIYYVDPGKASGVSGNGGTRADAFITVAEALSAMTADQDDVCVIASSSSTGRTSETAAIDWNKRRTHLIGNGPLRKINPRNGMSFGSAVVSPCFTVSATNCSFVNISIAQFNDVNVLVNVTAAYNTFDHVHFQGIGNATTGDDTAGRSLVITGADEIIVRNSTIGLDTVTRSAANASLELTGTCARCQFINCDFPIFADNAGAFAVLATTGNCTERYLKFENCLFTNAVQGSSTNLTVMNSISATGNGQVYFLDSWWYGATDLVDTVTNVFINNPVVDTADGGVLVVHANS